MSFVNFNTWRIKKMASYCIETGLIVFRRNGGRPLVEDVTGFVLSRDPLTRRGLT